MEYYGITSGSQQRSDEFRKIRSVRIPKTPRSATVSEKIPETSRTVVSQEDSGLLSLRFVNRFDDVTMDLPNRRGKLLSSAH
jgi:hypothetical protein